MNETIRVGDRVRIKARSYTSANHIGQTGTVTETDWLSYGNNDYSYAVDIDGGPAGRLYRREDLARVTPAPAADLAETVLPAANLQAATFAHQLLGDSADLDKLIGVAEFVMGAATGDKPAKAEEPAEVEASTEDLVITDRDGDKFTVSHYGDHPTLAKVYIRAHYDSGTQRAVYLTEADVDALIARLQSFKAEGFDQPF